VICEATTAVAGKLKQRQNAAMRLNLKNRYFQAASWLCILFICFPLHAQQETLQVLILNSFDENAAPYFRPTEEFKNRLQENYPTPIAFEDIDLKQPGRSQENQLDDALLRLLLTRYSGAPPQLVVAVGPPAIDFWVNTRDLAFPNALFIAMARDSVLMQTPLRPGDAVVATRFSFTGVVENILQLKPDTSRIVMVFGDSLSERVLSAAARKELEPYSGRLTLEFTNDMAIHEIQTRLADLPPDSAVFYGIFSGDVNGVKLQQYAGLAIVNAASTVPVFGTFDDQLGQGIIGGRLIQTGKVGVELAEAALDLLSGQPSPIEWKIVELSEPQYDWNELQLHGVDRHRLPAGSTVLFKPAGFWEQYAAWVLLVALVIAAQTWLVISLLRQRRQRRNAEIAHASLGRRLITAHEDERRLIARELHDDVSQRLARASMDASFAHANAGADSANEVLKNLKPELVRISKDVHDMSYRLHPSLVDDLGLVAALHSEIERVQRRSRTEITAEISEIREQLPSEKALCIYRITQESLQNAVKHAQAGKIEIEFSQKGEVLMLNVSDDGVGFDVAKVRDNFSLGLSSMNERAVLVNGALNIHSRPGEGTQVTLSVPCGGARS